MNQNHTGDDSVSTVPDKLEADVRPRLDGTRANQSAMLIYVANAFIEPDRQRLSIRFAIDGEHDFVLPRYDEWSRRLIYNWTTASTSVLRI